MKNQKVRVALLVTAILMSLAAALLPPPKLTRAA